MPAAGQQASGQQDGVVVAAHAAMLAAIVGGEGFPRVAEIVTEHVGAPVGIFVPRPGARGMAETPAERFVAELVDGGEPERPAGVAEAAPIVSGGEVQGAVLMFGEWDPDARPYLEAAALAALAGIAVLNALDDLAVPGHDSLLGDLLTRPEIGDGEILRRARLQGCHLGATNVALCVDPLETDPGEVVATIVSRHPGALIERIGARVYAVLPGTTPDEARPLTEELLGGTRPALSSRHRGATGARLALEEAGMLLAMAESAEYNRADDACWDPIRILYLAFCHDGEEIVRFAERTVGALVHQDEEQGSELQVTFWAYQRSNCNMNLTAKAIYAHRHTVSNRLARIQQLTGLDPVNGREREHLSLALKAHYVANLCSPPR